MIKLILTRCHNSAKWNLASRQKPKLSTTTPPVHLTPIYSSLRVRIKAANNRPQRGGSAFLKHSGLCFLSGSNGMQLRDHEPLSSSLFLVSHPDSWSSRQTGSVGIDYTRIWNRECVKPVAQETQHGGTGSRCSLCCQCPSYFLSCQCSSWLLSYRFSVRSTTILDLRKQSQ